MGLWLSKQAIQRHTSEFQSFLLELDAQGLFHLDSSRAELAPLEELKLYYLSHYLFFELLVCLGCSVLGMGLIRVHFDFEKILSHFGFLLQDDHLPLFCPILNLHHCMYCFALSQGGVLEEEVEVASWVGVQR